MKLAHAIIRLLGNGAKADANAEQFGNRLDDLKKPARPGRKAKILQKPSVFREAVSRRTAA